MLNLNYWAFCGNLNDLVGSENGFGGSNAILTSDKYGLPSSALDLSTGYIQLPSNVYFNSEYTVTAWLKIRSFKSNSRIIEIGNGCQNDSVIFALSNLKTGQLSMKFVVGSSVTSGIFNLVSPNISPLNTWIHVAFVLSKTSSIIYVNGKAQIQYPNNGNIIPRNVTRTKNYIGRSNCADDTNADAIIDELKIFNRALTQSEIQFDMTNQMYKSGILSLTNNWPLQGDLNDVITSTSLTSFGGISYTSDHLNNSNGALSLSPGYLQLPSDFYFSGDFTFSIWAKFDKIENYMRIIDCAAGSETNNKIVLYLITINHMTLWFRFEIFAGSYYIIEIYKQPPIRTDVWNHYAISLKDNFGRIYINGKLLGDGTLAVPNPVIRTNCYIGKSNFANEPQNASFSDIRIYSRALSSNEIQSIFDPSLQPLTFNKMQTLKEDGSSISLD